MIEVKSTIAGNNFTVESVCGKAEDIIKTELTLECNIDALTLVLMGHRNYKRATAMGGSNQWAFYTLVRGEMVCVTFPSK